MHIYHKMRLEKEFGNVDLETFMFIYTNLFGYYKYDGNFNYIKNFVDEKLKIDGVRLSYYLENLAKEYIEEKEVCSNFSVRFEDNEELQKIFDLMVQEYIDKRNKYPEWSLFREIFLYAIFFNNSEYTPFPQSFKFFKEFFVGNTYEKYIFHIEEKAKEQFKRNLRAKPYDPEKYFEFNVTPPNKKDFQNFSVTIEAVFDKGELKKIIFSEAEKYNLKLFLESLGFPYKDTYEEYLRYVKKVSQIKLRDTKDGFFNFVIGDFDEEALNEVKRLKEAGEINPFTYNFTNIVPKSFKFRPSTISKILFPSCITKKDLINHTHIVARSGSGKSELLKTMIKEFKKGVVLIDPHGDLANSFDGVEGFFKVAPIENRFVVNPFDIQDKSIMNRELVANEILQLLEEIIQDSSVSILMKTISFPIISTLLKLPYADFKMFADCMTPLGVENLEKLTPFVDEHLKGIWEEIKGVNYEVTKKSIYGRLQSFLNKSPIVNFTNGKDDFGEAIKRVENGENMIVSLPMPAMGEETVEVLGRFLMCRLQIWAKRRQEIPEEKRYPVFLIVDECQNFISDETARTLDQFGRKFGLYMTLAHQHMGQIDGKALKGSILANCKNKIVGLADPSTVNTMTSILGIEKNALDELNRGYYYGQFEFKKTMKFYAHLVNFEKTGEISYAYSQNTGFFDGWGDLPNQPPKNQTTPQNGGFTAKYDL